MSRPRAEHDTVTTILHARMEALTPSERQVASRLLQDYPVAGLHSITELAEGAQVSTPTVVRLARKLGFDGFTGLQDALRREISARIKRPISKLDGIDTDACDASDAHRLQRFAAAAIDNLQGTLARLDTAAFDAAAALLADPARRVFIAGGRITRSNADYLANHLQIIRTGVTALGPAAGVWPQHLVDMDAAAVLVIFDIRRYESGLLKLARLARDRDAALILLTDQWGSPVTAHATHALPAMVEAPSSWDSTLALMLIVETLIAEVQVRMGAPARDRIEAMEAMFSATRLFRDFN